MDQCICPSPFVNRLVETSGPAKAILFGEHAVVYGKPAIASSLGLRTKVRVEIASPLIPQNAALLHPPPEPPGYKFMLAFNVGMAPVFSSDGPLAAASIASSHIVSLYVALASFAAEKYAKLLDPAFWKRESAALKAILETYSDSVSFSKGLGKLGSGILSILFLSAIFFGPHLQRETLGIFIRTFSQIPMGAGLGSSAAFGVSLCASIFLLFSDKKLDLQDVFLWADVSETIIHGASSGLDPLVSVMGGSVYYSKTPEDMRFALPQVDFLADRTIVPFTFHANVCSAAVLYSGMSRKTSDMVARVKAFRSSDFSSFQKAMDEIEATVRHAMELFLDDASHFPMLSYLVSKNQTLLSASNPEGLDVDAPEFIKLRSAVEAAGIYPINVPFAAKITGAGGGGCALYVFANSQDRDVFIRQATSSDASLHPFSLLFPVDLNSRGVSVDACAKLAA